MDNTTIVEALKSEFGDAVLGATEQRGTPVLWVSTERLIEICRWLRDEPQCAYAYLSDVSALDRLTMQARGVADDPATEARFVLNYQLLSHTHRHRLWLKVALDGEPPRAPSVTGVWTGANFLEREVFDLMGIVFDGHPDLRRILMPEDWQGYPLRKDYPEAHEEVQFTHNFERIQRQKKYATR